MIRNLKGKLKAYGQVTNKLTFEGALLRCLGLLVTPYIMVSSGIVTYGRDSDLCHQKKAME